MGKNTIKLGLIAIAVVTAGLRPIAAKAASVDLAALEPDQLVWLAENLKGEEPETVAARKELASHLESEYLDSEQKTVKFSVRQWSLIARSVKDDLSFTDRKQWRERLEVAYVNGGIGELSSEEVLGLVSTLGSLGDRDNSLLAAQWVDESPDVATAKPGHLVSLSRHAFKAAAEGYRARRKLAAVVTAGLVNAPEKSAELSPSAWNRLTESLLDSLGPQDRAKWLARLQDLYVKAETPPDMDADEVRNLAVAIEQLGSDEALDIIFDWADRGDGQQLRDASIEQGARLAMLAVDDPQRAADILAQMEPSWEAAAADGTIGWLDHGKICRVWLRFGDNEKARLWAQRTLLATFGDEARRQQHAEMLVLNEVGYLLMITEQIDPQAVYDSYADAFVKAAEKGELDLAWRNPDNMAAPLTSAKAAQRARTALVDASGQARPMVAKILSVAYRDLGRLDELETYVESQLDQPDVAADTKATWLLARGCVEGAKSDEYAPLAGRTWFQQAFVTANDPNLRLMAIGEIALSYAELEHYQTAYQLIDSVSHQFATVEMQEKVDDLKGQIDSLRNWYTQAHITFAAEKGN